MSGLKGLPASSVVGVLGAGTMGAGIAQVAAAAGHRVRLFDTDGVVVERALDDMRERLERSVAKGRRTHAEVNELIERIELVPSLEDLRDTALVVEAIVERLDVKQRVFSQLEEIVPAGTILATNTSSLSVTAIAAGVQRPELVVGLHFFNPAPVMPLVEVVIGAATSPEVAGAAYATAAAWGKTPVRCTSTPGFIVNRVARPFYGESLRLLDEGVADIATIDAVVTGAGGFRMGPFTLMDLVGLDVNLAVSKSVYEQTFHDPRFAPHVRQQAKVDAGHLGRKSGRGWYDADLPGPASLETGPVPERVAINGDAEWDAMAARLGASGVPIARTDVPFLDVDGTSVHPAMGIGGTDAADVVLDLVLDWQHAKRVAVAVGARAADDAVAKVAGLFQAAEIDVSRVAGVPGLVLARIVAQLISVASDAAAAGVATPEDIDTAMRLGTNYPGGPFEWADAIGVAPVMMVLDEMRAFTGEERYRTSGSIRRAAANGTKLRDQARRKI
jgi:3-hydroxybutyryl-CoA dehydrogenase